jgi:hypothetical protein
MTKALKRTTANIPLASNLLQSHAPQGLDLSTAYKTLIKAYMRTQLSAVGALQNRRTKEVGHE